MRSVLALAIAVAACDRGTPPAPTIQPTAREILDVTVATYASAPTYVDRGRQTTVFRSARHEGVETLTFATSFVRRGDFRFEYYERGDPSRSFAVWRDPQGVHTRSYLEHGREERETSLDLAIAGATGISRGTANTIPRLLLPHEITGWSLADLRDPALDLDPAVVSGRTCWKITGRDVQGDLVEVWIDRGTHLVRKIASSHHFTATDRHGEFDTDDSTTYDLSVAGPRDAIAVHPVALPQPPPPPWLGIRLAHDTAAAHVAAVVPDGPGMRAGLQAGDDLVAIDATPIGSPRDVPATIGRLAVGTRVLLTISRRGQTLQIPVVLALRPDLNELAYRKLVDHPAPDFALRVVANTGTAKLSELAGKVVLLGFWPTWCKPCDDIIPRFEALHEKYAARGLRVVGISDGTAAAIATYARDHRIRFPLARDDSGVVAQAYWAAGVPEHVLIDRAGVVRDLDPDLSHLEDRIVELLK